MDYNWFGDGFRKIIENNGSFLHFSPIIGYMGDGVAICFTKDLTTRSLTLVVFSWSWDLEQIFSRSSAQIYLTQSRRVKTDCISKILKRSCLQDVRLGCIVHRNVSIARTLEKAKNWLQQCPYGYFKPSVGYWIRYFIDEVALFIDVFHKF